MNEITWNDLNQRQQQRLSQYYRADYPGAAGEGALVSRPENVTDRDLLDMGLICKIAPQFRVDPGTKFLRITADGRSVYEAGNPLTEPINREEWFNAKVRNLVAAGAKPVEKSPMQERNEHLMTENARLRIELQAANERAYRMEAGIEAVAKDLATAANLALKYQREVNAWHVYSNDCPFCHGSGIDNTGALVRPCEDCNGTGKHE